MVGINRDEFNLCKYCNIPRPVGLGLGLGRGLTGTVYGKKCTTLYELNAHEKNCLERQIGEVTRARII